MIKVDFFTDDKGLLLGFDMYGHAEYDEHGQDIVCAAVSSAAYLTINMISEIIKIPADINVKNTGGMYLKIKEDYASLCRDILLGFKLHMLNLEEQYPQNITVNYMEV